MTSRLPSRLMSAMADRVRVVELVQPLRAEVRRGLFGLERTRVQIRVRDILEARRSRCHRRRARSGRTCRAPLRRAPPAAPSDPPLNRTVTRRVRQRDVDAVAPVREERAGGTRQIREDSRRAAADGGAAPRPRPPPARRTGSGAPARRRVRRRHLTASGRLGAGPAAVALRRGRLHRRRGRPAGAASGRVSRTLRVERHGVRQRIALGQRDVEPFIPPSARLLRAHQHTRLAAGRARHVGEHRDVLKRLVQHEPAAGRLLSACRRSRRSRPASRPGRAASSRSAPYPLNTTSGLNVGPAAFSDQTSTQLRTTTAGRRLDIRSSLSDSDPGCDERTAKRATSHGSGRHADFAAHVGLRPTNDGNDDTTTRRGRR